jgi:hypothetical protein
MRSPPFDAVATLADGRGPGWLSPAEIYDPAANAWLPAAPLRQARTCPMVRRLASGKVLVIGGEGPIDTTGQNDAVLFAE